MSGCLREQERNLFFALQAPPECHIVPNPALWFLWHWTQFLICKWGSQ